MEIKAQTVNSAALINPVESSGFVKLRRVVAIVPMKTAVFNHFW